MNPASHRSTPLARIPLAPPGGDGSRGSRIGHGSPLLEGEGQGEVCDLSGESTHLTPTLSFQERGPVAFHANASGPCRKAISRMHDGAEAGR